MDARRFLIATLIGGVTAFLARSGRDPALV